MVGFCLKNKRKKKKEEKWEQQLRETDLPDGRPNQFFWVMLPFGKAH